MPRRYDDDEDDRPRSRRRDDDDDDRPRSRRRDEDDRPRSRRRDDEDDRSRSRRRDSDDDRPRSKRPLTREPRRKSASRLPLLIGGGVALVIVIVVVIVLAVRKSDNDAAKVTVENFNQIKAGNSLEDVEKILGKGTECDATVIQKEYTDAFDPVTGGFEMLNASMSPADTWYRWHGNNMTIFVGFGKAAGGVERVAYSCWLKKDGKVAEKGVGVQLLRGLADLDEAGRKSREDGQLLKDAKWRKSAADVQRLLVGEWRTPDTSARIFKKDGTFRYIHYGWEDYSGIWQVTGDQEAEFTFKGRMDFAKPEPNVWKYTVLVSDDELYIMRVLNPQTTIKEGPYYRMRPDGRGPGWQMVLDPLIQKLNSPKVNERQSAASSLQRLGACTLPVLPQMLAIAKKNDPSTVDGVIQAIGSIGPPAAKQALPVLIDILRTPKSNGYLACCIAISRFGPDAKQALPALKELRAKKGIPAVVANELDGTIRKLEQ